MNYGETEINAEEREREREGEREERETETERLRGERDGFVTSPSVSSAVGRPAAP